MQEDDTVMRLAHKSMAMSALSFIDRRSIPPLAVMAPFLEDARSTARWIEQGPLVVVPVLAALSALPTLLVWRPLAFDNAMAIVLLWLVIAALTLFAQHTRHAQWTPALRQIAWVLPATIPVLLFRPFDVFTQITAVALFTAWGVLYYLVPATAARLKLWLVIGASATFLVVASLTVAINLPAGGATQVILIIALIAICLVAFNVLGIYFSRRLQRMYLQTRVQRRLIDLLREELNTLAESDELTGLASRKRALEVLQHHWEQPVSEPITQPQLSLIMVGVDYLAELNEHYGRHIGDVCLTRIASQLRTQVRTRDDCVARYAGTTFLMVMHNCDERRAAQVGEKVRQSVESMSMLNPKSPAGWVVTVSVGVCGSGPRAGHTCADAIQDVKSILARAKSTGGNRVFSRQGAESSGSRNLPHSSPADITRVMGTDDTTVRRRRASLQVVH